MTDVSLTLPDGEARALYRWIHRAPGAQDQFVDAYRQLQAHYFAGLTVEELTALLEADE